MVVVALLARQVAEMGGGERREVRGMKKENNKGATSCVSDIASTQAK